MIPSQDAESPPKPRAWDLNDPTDARHYIAVMAKAGLIEITGAEHAKLSDEEVLSLAKILFLQVHAPLPAPSPEALH